MASSPAEHDRWVKVYPIYIDNTKSVAQGRKLAKELAVAKPTLAELATAAKKLGLLCLEEPEKAYSRDPVIEVGRIRVQLKLDKTPVNPDIANSMCRRFTSNCGSALSWHLRWPIRLRLF